ncbi:MAG: hypothetical protein H0X40_18035 [Chthoniobacterales bacterium]|nr:hypothetical protein [Chthoniobacterales bacterium]
MIFRRRTQKEISEKYQGNLDLYKKVQPWRLSRFLASFFALSLGIAAIIAFQKRGTEKFFNPGKLSRAHTSLADGCASCHGHPMDADQLRQVNFQKTLHDRLHNGVEFAPIDQHCASCHYEISQRTYTFHEPNVIRDRSCSVCHQEHRGAETMRIVASAQCASCHDDVGTMTASADKGRGLDWKNFHRHPHPPQQVVFDLPRPPAGYTQTFAAFWDGHPQFQLKREPVRDFDMLKFNHQRHFEADIPLVGGQRLACTFCHQPDTEGRYNNARITFAAQCQVCHSLQLDPKNPELTLPHGSTVAVHGFLHDLPARYADLALQKGITRPNEIRTFVTQQMLQLRERVRSGEDFENQIFFVADPYKLRPGTESRVRASFYGCALCHEVRPVANGAPSIPKPVFVDRWMPQAKFNHGAHTMVKCDDCHHATRSSLTSDVLMPGIESCVRCHSPQGKVVASCITCHSYHAPSSLAVAQTLPATTTVQQPNE